MVQMPNRRRVLKTIVGLTGATVFDREFTFGSGEETVKITTVKRGDEPLEEKRVSEDWYHDVLEARKIQYNLYEEYSSEEWLQTTSRVPSINNMYDKTGPLVIVYAYDTDIAESVFPERTNDIPIVIKSAATTSLDQSCDPPTWICEDDTYDCVPGGGLVFNEDTNNDINTGTTSTCPVEFDGETHLMASHHPHEDDSCESVIGLSLYQNDNCEKNWGNRVCRSRFGLHFSQGNVGFGYRRH